MDVNVVGIDLSTKAIDLVKLSEDSNRAEWVRCELAGATAWERAMSVREALTNGMYRREWPMELNGRDAFWWDDVYLVAIERPVNDQKRVLRLIQGAVIASLPAKLRQPHCCWEIHPSTWKAGLGLKGKPTNDDLAGFEPDMMTCTTPELVRAWLTDGEEAQNARDAYCLALYARDTNARAVEKALGAA